MGEQKGNGEERGGEGKGTGWRGDKRRYEGGDTREGIRGEGNEGREGRKGFIAVSLIYFRGINNEIFEEELIDATLLIRTLQTHFLLPH